MQPWRRGIHTLVYFVVAASVGLVGCTSASGRSALSDLADSLASQAAEGSLLAEAAAGGDVTGTFTQEHARDLRDSARSEHETLLAFPADPSVDPQLSTLRTLSERISNDLDALSGSPADPGALADDLRSASQAAQSTAEELG